MYKKLSYRRGTARCVVSVEICQLTRNSAETTCTTSPEQVAQAAIAATELQPSTSGEQHSTDNETRPKQARQEMDRQSSYPETARGPERPLSPKTVAAVRQQAFRCYPKLFEELDGLIRLQPLSSDFDCCPYCRTFTCVMAVLFNLKSQTML